MRISDWSSDVCSSDLIPVRVHLRLTARRRPVSVCRKRRPAELDFQTIFVIPARVQPEPEKPQSLLSQPQVETMRHVYEQKNSKQIARLMDVSPHTVDERPEEHKYELQSLMRTSSSVFRLKNKQKQHTKI